MRYIKTLIDLSFGISNTFLKCRLVLKNDRSLKLSVWSPVVHLRKYRRVDFLFTVNYDSFKYLTRDNSYINRPDLHKLLPFLLKPFDFDRCRIKYILRRPVFSSAQVELSLFDGFPPFFTYCLP